MDVDQAQGIRPAGLKQPVRDQGSFRDPTGFVCHLDGEVYRAVDASFAALFDTLQRSGVLADLQQRGGLIGTREVAPDDPALVALRTSVPGVERFLHHDKVPFISYPYEWSHGMLADAALCCLDLELLLVEHGYSLKDASAYNVQFVPQGAQRLLSRRTQRAQSNSLCAPLPLREIPSEHESGRPVFIDVPSIETVTRRDVWAGLNQFCRMFLYPLLLHRYSRCDLKGYFLSSLDGATPTEVLASLGRLAMFRPGLWLDLVLPEWLQRFSRADGASLRRKVDARQTNANALILNLKRLRRKILRLGSRPASGSTWLGYAKDNSYDEAAENTKIEFVSQVLRAEHPRRVLDIGCNTGRYSELAADSGASVIALDSDTACVDALYRRVRDGRLNILPLVMDVANPSPGLGFCNRERQSFLDRANFDCVMALALVHHLLVTSRLPLESVCDLLADLTGDLLIVEFVEPRDAMFERLLGARENIYEHLTLSAYRQAFSRRFAEIRCVSVNATRTLVAYRKRG